MPRFVVLLHRMPAGERGDHWDLMFESQDALRTWAIDWAPVVGQSGLGRRLADHRLEYLEYEGPISGNRGSVRRWDAGCYELVTESENVWRVRLAGSRLAGEARLERIDDQRWRVSINAPGDAAAGDLASGDAALGAESAGAPGEPAPGE